MLNKYRKKGALQKKRDQLENNIEKELEQIWASAEKKYNNFLFWFWIFSFACVPNGLLLTAWNVNAKTDRINC